MNKEWKIGPFSCRFDEETYSWLGWPLGYPTLYIFLGGAMPIRSIELSKTGGIREAREISLDVCSGIMSNWLKEAAKFRADLDRLDYAL